MKPFRLDRRRCLAVLAGCLAAVLAGWLATLAMPAGTLQPGVSAILTAAQEPQARILNPGPPTGLAAIAGDGRVTLSWSAPASDGGAAIIGYDVYLGTSSGGESVSPVSAGLIAGTSYTVGGLKNGTTYYFTADAVNGANLHSVASAEDSATPVAPVTVPGAPGGLTATAGDARVSLKWKAPGSNGGAAITGYRVYLGTGKNPVASVTGTGATVKNLANGTRYSFKVSAVNTAGEGPASAAVSATPTAATSPPGPPNGLTASPGNGQVTPTPVAAGASATASGSPSAGTTPTAAGAPAAPTGLTATPGTAVLDSATQQVPKPVIISLAAVAAAAIAAGLALTVRRLRKRRRTRPPAAPPSDVRAVPETGPPHPVNLHEVAPHDGACREVALPETYVVRLEPLPAAIITTLEEIGS